MISKHVVWNPSLWLFFFHNLSETLISFETTSVFQSVWLFLPMTNFFVITVSCKWLDFFIIWTTYRLKIWEAVMYKMHFTFRFDAICFLLNIVNHATFSVEWFMNRFLKIVEQLKNILYLFFFNFSYLKRTRKAFS